MPRTAPMPIRWFVVLALLPASVVAADELSNLRQLESMPRERRMALDDNLERFDKLDSAEQASIRKLEAEISRKDPIEQERYRTLLKRYHSWVNSLPDEERVELKAADGTESRLKLVRKFRQREKAAGAIGSGPKVFGMRTGDFGLTGPYEAAQYLRIWKVLTAQKRLEIGRLPDRKAQFRAIAAQQKSVGVPPQPFPHAEEARYEAPLNADDNFKKQLGTLANRITPFAKKTEVNPKAEPPHSRFELRFAEFLYFEEHKPRAVPQANLERFSASCPAWFLETLDPLSPDDARAYLTIVYRLIYPDSEMPVDPKSTKATEPAKGQAEKPFGKVTPPSGPL